MNKNQWFVLSIGSIALSIFLFTMTGPICTVLASNELLTSCFIRRYAYAIPAIIFQFAGWIFMVCGYLESKKK